VLASLPPIRSVLDLACGLNPLTLPWMGLPDESTYTAVDIFEDLRTFLNAYFDKFHVTGQALCADLTQTLPPVQADLTLLLKTIPCLEQVDKHIGKKLLESIPAENILVSFPSRSLGGQSKGMAANYDAHFKQLISGRNWHVARTDFPNEITYLIQK